MHNYTGYDVNIHILNESIHFYSKGLTLDLPNAYFGLTE